MSFAFEQFYRLFQGALVFQCVFLVFLFLLARKKDIGYYAAYLLLLSVYFFWNAPNTFFNLDDNEIFGSRIYAFVNTPIIILTHVAYIHFLRHFFHESIQSTWLNRGVRFFTILAPLLILYSVLMVYFQISNQNVFYFVNFFSTGISLYILWYIFRYSIKGVRLVVAGMILNIAGNALTVLMIVLWRAKIHHILTDGYPLFFMRCGILADIFLYMMAILQKLNFNEKQLAIQKLSAQLAVEKMKNRISKELHDDIGSTLSGINMYTHLAKQQGEQGNREAAYKTLEVIQQASDEMIYKLKDIVWEIQPNNGSIQQLCDKIKDYAVFITAPKSITLQTNFAEEETNCRIPAEKQHHIYNIAKEALNNAAKYSGANRISIESKADRRLYAICIADDGIGFDKMQGMVGNGLANMQKRAAEIGADFTIETAPFHGCIITLVLKITQ
jgi:signal transduction histidine kinase